MPYDLLQSILGATFMAVWCFIAVTLFSDKLREVRSRRLKSQPPRPHFSRRRRAKRQRDLVAEH